MPATRAARRTAAWVAVREANEQASFLCRLPLDVQASILYHLTTAHDIALAGLTCHSLCDAAKLALKARPFSSEVVQIKEENQHGVERAVALPDGRFIIGTSYGEMKLWHPAVPTFVDAEDDDDYAHTDLVRGLALLPRDGRFVSSSNDNTAKLWSLPSLATVKLERTFEEDGLVGSIAALPDGVHFVVGLWSGELKLYHIDGTLVHVFDHAISLVPDDDVKGHTSFVNAVAVTRDGQHIISGSSDCKVIVWSVATKSLASICDGPSSPKGHHIGEIWAVEAMPDGQRILSGGSDCTVRVNLLDGTLENTFSELTKGWVMTLVALPDNQHALSGGGDLDERHADRKHGDNSIKLFNVNTGVILRSFKHHTGPVNSLALLPDGLRFISGSDDDTACIVYHGLAPQ
jgi:WD40 repeat protein